MKDNHIPHFGLLLLGKQDLAAPEQSRNFQLKDTETEHLTHSQITWSSCQNKKTTKGKATWPARNKIDRLTLRHDASWHQGSSTKGSIGAGKGHLNGALRISGPCCQARQVRAKILRKYGQKSDKVEAGQAYSQRHA